MSLDSKVKRKPKLKFIQGCIEKFDKDAIC